jgi:Retinal pigment epithelial membrane protein
VVNPLRLKFSGKPFIRNYQWEPDRGGPVSRRREGKRASGAEQRGAGRAVFAFHHVNASRGRRGVVDIVAFPDSGVINQVYLDPLRSAEPVTATESSPSSGSARVRTFLMRGCRRPGSNFPALTPVPRRTPAPLRLWGWERGAGKLHRQSREVGPRA